MESNTKIHQTSFWLEQNVFGTYLLGTTHTQSKALRQLHNFWPNFFLSPNFIILMKLIFSPCPLHASLTNFKIFAQFYGEIFFAKFSEIIDSQTKRSLQMGTLGYIFALIGLYSRPLFVFIFVFQCRWQEVKFTDNWIQTEAHSDVESDHSTNSATKTPKFLS